jgi:hypothetical protein
VDVDLTCVIVDVDVDVDGPRRVVHVHGYVHAYVAST